MGMTLYSCITPIAQMSRKRCYLRVKARGVVGRKRVGTAFPHLFQVLLENEFEAVSKWLFFVCVPTPFLLAL